MPEPSTHLRDKARLLRANQTRAEGRLWRALRNRQLAGARFRRQQPIGPYIADFCCWDHRLVVEIDGGQHAERVEQDHVRTTFIESQGLRVIRFWNNQVLQNLDGVLEVIHRTILER